MLAWPPSTSPKHTHTNPCTHAHALSIHAQIRVREDQERVIAGLAPEHLGWLLDLRPFMQRTPFVVNEDASLQRGYRWVGGWARGWDALF